MNSVNNVIELLSSQMTTRAKEFSDRVIPDESIEIIKKAIIHSPNSSNRQIYSVIILDQGQVGILRRTKCSHAFVFCVDFNRLHHCAGMLNRRFDSSYLTQFLSGVVDISLLAQSSIIAARSLGIDTLVTNDLFTENDFSIYDKLNIPQKHCIPVLSLFLGYSEKKAARQKGRLPVNVLFHNGKYHEPSLDEYRSIINRYDDENNNLCLNDAWKKLNYGHYLDWFFDKWSPVIGSRKNCEEYIKELVKREIL